jgi:hypothetical protein
MALPDSAGDTSVPSSSTKKIMVENTPPPPDSQAEVASQSRNVTMPTSSMKTPSSTYQERPRTRWRSSSVTINQSPVRNRRLRSFMELPPG